MSTHIIDPARRTLLSVAMAAALLSACALNPKPTPELDLPAVTATTPAEMRAPAPAPVEIASGSTPRMKASEVMRIGRKRSRAASTAAAEADSPSSCLSTAYSTIRIAFLAARPSSVTRPIWK